VTFVFVLGAFAFEIANGEDGSPYGQIGAVAGVAYIVAVAVLRRRS
jgi:formate hydrogenlyase subunit 4